MEDRKLHEETLKIAKDLIEKDPALKDWVTEKFPELKESEDEKMIRIIMKTLQDINKKDDSMMGDILLEDCIAWLEKQGNISPTEDELEALRIAAYEPIKNWSEKLQSLYEKLACCEQGEQILANSCKISKDEQNLAWNDEDYKMINSLITDYEEAVKCSNDVWENVFKDKVNWLKSLKERMKGE